MQGHPSRPAGGVPVGGGRHPTNAVRRHPAPHRAVAPRRPGPDMTSACVKNLELRHRAARSVCRSRVEIVFSSPETDRTHNPVGHVFAHRGKISYCVAGVLVLRWSAVARDVRGLEAIWEIPGQSAAPRESLTGRLAAFCVVLKPVFCRSPCLRKHSFIGCHRMQRSMATLRKRGAATQHPFDAYQALLYP